MTTNKYEHSERVPAERSTSIIVEETAVLHEMLSYSWLDGMLYAPPGRPLSRHIVYSAHWKQGSKGEQAGNQGELGEFYEVTETWLAFYDEVRELAARKQTELKRQLLSSAEDRGNLCTWFIQRLLRASTPPPLRYALSLKTTKK